MIEAANNGEIDIILTKSIQRFARNTVDLLETVRHLKDISVEVQFEKEHINSMSGDGELMITILASFAQEESRSLSENCKCRAYPQGALRDGHIAGRKKQAGERDVRASRNDVEHRGGERPCRTEPGRVSETLRWACPAVRYGKDSV